MGALLPCFNERKGSVKFFHECTLPVTDCELRFEDEMMLRWPITKLNLYYQRLDFTFNIGIKLEKRFALHVKAKWAESQENQHYSQSVALLKFENGKWLPWNLFSVALIAWYFMLAGHHEKCNISISYQLTRFFRVK